MACSSNAETAFAGFPETRAVRQEVLSDSPVRRLAPVAECHGQDVRRVP